jgi:hypothetical protein
MKRIWVCRHANGYAKEQTKRGKEVVDEKSSDFQ